MVTRSSRPSRRPKSALSSNRCPGSDEVACLQRRVAEVVEHGAETALVADVAAQRERLSSNVLARA